MSRRGRPRKENADYFPHDTDMRNDPAIRVLRSRWRNDGYAFWGYLLEKLSDANGFRLEWSQVDLEVEAADMDLNQDDLVEMLATASRLDLLSVEVTQDGTHLIHCDNLDARFASLIARREYRRDKNTFSDGHKSQTKLEESKQEERESVPAPGVPAQDGEDLFPAPEADGRGHVLPAVGSSDPDPTQDTPPDPAASTAALSAWEQLKIEGAVVNQADDAQVWTAAIDLHGFDSMLAAVREVRQGGNRAFLDRVIAAMAPTGTMSDLKLEKAIGQEVALHLHQREGIECFVPRQQLGAWVRAYGLPRIAWAAKRAGKDGWVFNEQNVRDLLEGNKSLGVKPQQALEPPLDDGDLVGLLDKLRARLRGQETAG